MLADAEKAKGKAVTAAEKLDAVRQVRKYRRMVEELSKPDEAEQEQETEKSVGKGAFGEIYDGFKGKWKAAIEFLKKKQSGEAVAALHHHTIGDISLVWGDKKMGLSKILTKHPEVVDNLQDIIDGMEVVLESENRIKLESPTHFAVISKEYLGEPREKWLLTAFEKKDASGGSMDIVPEPQRGKQNGTATLQDTFTESKDKNINRNVQGENDGRRFAEQPELNGNHEGMTAIEQADGTHKWVGLQRSVVTDGMSEREIALLDELGRRMGLPIVAVDIADSRFNGKYADGVVYINVNRDKDWTMRWVAGHELLHDVERLSPEAYNAYKDAVRELFGEEYFEGKVKDTMDVYAEAGQPIGREQAEREVVNDFGGDLFSSRDGLRIMERILDRAKRDGQPKLVKMLLDWWDKVKDFFGTTPYANDVRKALEEAYADAMRNANERMRADDGKAEMSAKRKRALETAEQSQRTTIATAVSSADGTKILKNLDKLVNDLEKSSSHRKTFIGDLANAFGVDNRGKASKYATFETKNGKVVTIRLSNHNATVSNFDSVGESDGISIVVTRKPNKGITNDGMAHIVEFFYPEIALQRAERKPLAEIAKSIKQVLYSGEYKDTTGLAEVQEVNRAELDSEPLSAKIESASAEVNTEPTEAQKEAGNYKKGHVKVGKFDISIEQPEGSIRRGTDADGKQWESKMHNTYGYFRGTEGVDGDHIDVFLSNNMDGWNREKAFVVDQYNPDGTFDEHKVMLGFNDAAKAKSDYLANYEKGWENGRRIDITGVNLEDFEKWIDSSHRKTKPFGEYKSIKPVELGNEEFSIVSDKKKIKELEKEELVPMYRTFQEIDGKLYPPMANIQDGERSHAFDEAVNNNDDILFSIKREREKALRDAVIGRMRKSGIDVIDNDTEGQRVLDMVNGKDVREHKVYHGSGADFEAFDHSHMGEGEGLQAHGWGTYVTMNEGLAKGYAIKDAEEKNREEASLIWKRKPSSIEEVMRDLEESYPESFGEWLYKKWYNPYRAKLEKILKTIQYGNEYDLDGLRKELSIEIENPNNSENEKSFYSAVEEVVLPYALAYQPYERNLYSVEIPKNNGQNYIEEFKNYGAKTKLRRAIESALQRIGIEGIGNDVMSGREIYTTLTKKLGSKEKASKFLGDLGLMGVHYYGASDGECYVIFNESDAKITDHVRFFRTADGEAYGFTVGGKVYIDPRIATAETPVHEYTHLWSSALRTSKPNDWQRVVGLMKDTAVWEEVKSNYKELKTDDDIADEVLAQFSGKRGAERLRAEMQKAKGDAKDVAENALNKVKQALADFWKGVCDMLGVKYTSADNVADKVLSDLLEGVNPTDPDGGGKRADESLIDYAKRKAEQYSIKKSFGGNSGYVGYSKSKRAVDAEDRGLRSVSNMDREFAEEVSEIVSRESGKEAKVSLAEVKRIAKDMRGDEWHHTSKYGNRTQYYSAESIAERILADREPKSEELVADDKERESALGRVRDALVTDRDVKTVVVDRGRETEYTNDAFTSSNGYQIVVGKGMFGEKRTFRNTQFLNNDKVDKRELYLPEWYMDDHIDELQKAMDEYNASLDDALGKEADAIVDLPQYSIKIPEGGVRRFFELYPTLQDYKSKLENDFDLAKRYYEKKDNIITERAFYDAKSALEYADIEYRRAKELLAMYDRKNTGVKAFKPLSLKPSYKDPEATKKLANILGKTHTIDYSNYIQAMEALKMNPFLDNAEKYLNYEFGKEKSMYGDYREAFPTITMDDYFLFTKVEFKPVDTNGKSVDDVWQELKDSGKYEEHHSPKSTSKYLVDYNSGEIIRQSDHWGLVASCYWPYGGEEIEGEMQIGRTNIAEMKPNLNYNAHGRSNRQNMAALPKQSENVWKSLQQTIVNYEALLKDDRFNLTEEVRDIINNRILAYGQFADNFMSAEIPDSKIDLSRFHGVSYSIKGARGANDFANGNGFIVKKGDEAIGEMMRIFEEKRVPSLQESIKGISEFKRIFANPIQTILGKMIRVKDEVYNKMLRKSRGTISSAVLPTLQDADFVIRESNGSTLYVKRFKNNENEHIYNIVVVNKQNEVEDYISSAHIKTNNNLLNKIKQGAELLIPTKRTNYGILSPSNSTPDANVGNNSEPANKIGENFSIKNGKKESDFKLAEQNLADEMHYGKKVAEKLRQIEEMKQGIKDGNAQVKDIAKQMREFIEESVPNEMQDDMTRLDFKGVLKALDTATTTKDLEKPMRTVDEIGTYLASRALNKRLGEILSKKYRSTNAKGVAVARAVDNTTRVVMDYAKQLYRDMGNNGVSQQLFGLRLDRKDIVDEMKALAKSTGDADISAMVESVEKVMKAKQDKRKAMLTELRDEMSVETASKVGGYIDQLLDTQEKIDSTIAKGDENISKAPENAVESLKTLAQEIGEREDAGTMSEDDRAIRDALPLLMMITDIRQRTIDNNGVGIGTVENKIRTNQLALKDLYKQKSATDAQREAKVQKIAEIKADIEQLKAGQLIDQKAINNDTARLIADFKQLLRKICA